jgi:hypothetical protein
MDGQMNSEDIVKEAHIRFALLEEREKENRALWIDDVKFANGNSDNGWQWNTSELRARGDEKPSLTVNKVKQHNRQIINDGRENKTSIVIKPEGNGAHAKTAEIIQGIVKHIEKNSNADTAYDVAYEFAIEGGLGYWWITTDYVDNETNDQEIYIKPIKNPLNVYLADGEEFDGSDSKYGFIFDELEKEDFNAKYPGEDENVVTWGMLDNNWKTDAKIRVANYYKVVETKDKLFFLPDGQAIKLSDIEDPEQKKAITADKSIKRRDIIKRKVLCYTIAGDKVIEEYEWPGTSIPIIPVKGDEKVIDGEVCRTGNTRLMKDSQRMYNYELSCEIEYKMLQGKTPWIAPIEAIAGFEKVWETANTINHSVLPFNHIDDAGNTIPAPQRIEPPLSSQAYLDGMKIASDDMQASSGQYDAQLGQNVNQQSGRALLAVQNRGAVSTFHFADNKARALERTGRIILELIPKIYDIEGVKRIVGDDEKEKEVEINPNQKEAYKKVTDRDGKIREIFNPGVGRYMVQVQVGANYGTRRQEAFNALTDIASRNPDFMAKAGDIYFEIADFPLAEKVAERFRKTLPPGLAEQEDDDAPQIPMEIQQKLADSEQIMMQMDQTIQQMKAALDEKSAKDEEIKIKRFEAATKRLQVNQGLPRDPEGNLIYLQEIDDMNEQQFQALINALQQLAASQEQIAQLAAMAAAPRKSELQLDQNGMPVGSVSYAMEPPQQPQPQQQQRGMQ